MNWRSIAAGTVLLIGLTQMTGELLGNRVLKGLGAVTVIAPCPKVFCDLGGFEPFAADFAIVADEGRGPSTRITPELYARMRGPYNRRNVYGAAIAAGPLLPKPIRESVLRYGLGESGPLRRDFGFPENTGLVGVMVRDGTRGRHGEWFLRCAE